MIRFTQMLLSRWEAEPPRLTWDDYLEVNEEARRLWGKLSFLKEDKPATSVRCTDCGETCRIQWVSTASRKNIPVAKCASCGSERVDPQRLQQWRIDHPQFLRSLAAPLGLNGEPKMLLTNQLWYWGRLQIANIRPGVYVCRSRSSSIVREHCTGNPILMVCTEETAQELKQHARVITLESSLRLTPSGWAIIGDWRDEATRIMADSGLIQPAKRQQKRGDRLANIEKLIKEMKKHLDQARAVLTDGFLVNTEAELLPRPTQAELAKRTKLSEGTVSNCLRDKQGKELRYLWELALKREKVLNWKSCYYY